MPEIHDHYLFSRLIGDAFVDVSDVDMGDATWFTDLLDAEVGRRTEERVFNLNTVDVTINWADGSVYIRDALGTDEKLQVRLADLLAALRTLRDLSSRVRSRIDADFSSCREEAYATIGQIHGHDNERLPAAAVIRARGDIAELKLAIAQSHLDWRDLLVSAGLENATWRADLDEAWG